MNEIVLKNTNKKRIDEILAGECFIHDNRIYIRTMYHEMDVLCVELTDGDYRYFSPETQVLPIKLKMVEI